MHDNGVFLFVVRSSANLTMRRNLPSLPALYAFEMVYRLQNISAAAKALAFTQSAVSKKIQALETYFEQPLFERRASGLVPTAAADLLWARLPPCLDELEGVMQEVLASRHGGGVLNLAVFPTFATKWLVPRLPLLYQAHPGLTINLKIQLSRVDFGGSGLDAGIAFGRPPWANCEHHWIADETLVPVCSADFIARHGRPDSLRDLTRFTLLHQTSRPDTWSNWFDFHGISAPIGVPGLHFELFSMAAEAAKAGLGIGLLPAMFVADEIKRATLIALFPPEKQSDGAYYLIYPKRKAGLPGLMSFQRWLIAQAVPAPTID